MHALHHGDNTEAMRQRVNILMARFPQVQMVMFSELLAKGLIIPEPSPDRELWTLPLLTRGGVHKKEADTPSGSASFFIVAVAISDRSA
jgi:hypothetical protein